MCGENGLLSRSVVIGRAAVFASSPATQFALFIFFYRPPQNLVLILYFQPRRGSVEDNTTQHNAEQHNTQTGGRFQKLKRIIVVGETFAVSIF